MEGEHNAPRQWTLLLGDLLTLGMVTLAGFGFHGEANAGGRMLTTFGPLSLAWLLVGPHLGVFDRSRVASARELWRPFWAMVLAAPLAAWLRGMWLGTPIQPVFVIVLGGISSLALFGWRLVHWALLARGRGQDG